MRQRLVLAVVLLWGACATASALAQNVLLFTVDSCRADRFGVYGCPRPNTPHIDAWAKTGTVFQEAYSVSAWTAPGLVSILTGLYPPAHGVNNRDRTGPDSLNTLVRILHGKGYRIPNLNFFTFAPYYQNLGLDQVQRSYFDGKEGDELINWLQANAGASGKGPFFVWYHTTLVHLPYNPGPNELPAPQSKLEKSAGIKAVLNGAIVPIGSAQFQPEDRPVLDRLYDAELKRVDTLFHAALETLKRKGVLADTLVILTADHGEELLDHGFVGHASTSLQAKLYQELIHIPLIVSWPGKIPPRQRVEERVSQIDILPTVLNQLGLKPDPQLPGLDLFGKLPKDRTLFFESVISGNQTIKEHENIWVRAILSGDYKFISNDELYNLKDDPEERVNLVERESEKAGKLRAALDLWVRETTVASPAASFSDPSWDPTRQECPIIETPRNDSTLSYDLHTGAVLLDWSGSMDMRYLVQYEIGEGDHYISGTFEMEGNHQLLGPLSPELWKNLKAWNPFRIRVSPRSANPCWSEWLTFQF